MNLYEHIVMMPQEIGQNQIRFALNKYKKLIEKHAGTLCSYEFWGLRKLAYPIRKQEKAFYFLLNLKCGSKLINELTFFANNSNAILRYLTIKVENFELNSELKSEDIYSLMSELEDTNTSTEKVGGLND